MAEKDVFRDTWVRYLGYANEVGEAFRPLIDPMFVKASYVVSTGYVCADAIDKASRAHRFGASGGRVVVTALDVLLWQALASVIIPGFTINRVTYYASQLIRRSSRNPEMIKYGPTAIGLLSIPLIIHPIDTCVDWFMDHTFRKIF